MCPKITIQRVQSNHKHRMWPSHGQSCVGCLLVVLYAVCHFLHADCSIIFAHLINPPFWCPATCIKRKPAWMLFHTHTGCVPHHEYPLCVFYWKLCVNGKPMCKSHPTGCEQQTYAQNRCVRSHSDGIMSLPSLNLTEYMWGALAKLGETGKSA